MRHYELMVILDPQPGRAHCRPVADTFLNVVRKDGGNVRQGRCLGQASSRVRSREAPKASTRVVDITAEPATVKELDRQLGLNESVLRTKVLRHGK
ncbi:30S ribosomal protein S6 [Rhodococcus hoagii]|nr:30S ribosomal protein S6 [Prescottella equi]